MAVLESKMKTSTATVFAIAAQDQTHDEPFDNSGRRVFRGLLYGLIGASVCWFLLYCLWHGIALMTGALNR